MEGFLICGWNLILPVCGGTSTLAREATLAARWLYISHSQPATSQWGWGLHTLLGGIDPGDLPFRPRFVEVVETWNDF